MKTRQPNPTTSPADLCTSRTVATPVIQFGTALLGPLRAVANAMLRVAREPKFQVMCEQLAGSPDGAMPPAIATTITPEDTLRGAGIDDARQAEYQRKMSAMRLTDKAAVGFPVDPERRPRSCRESLPPRGPSARFS